MQIESILCLHLRRPLEERLDASCLTPDLLASRSRQEILQLPLPSSRSDSKLKDWFDVEGDPSETVVIDGSCHLLDRVGTNMSRGMLHFKHDVGDYAGLQMRAGTLRIEGNCGDMAASTMRGGCFCCARNTGHHLGAPVPGSLKGVQGGEIFIGGSVGDDACHRMRRGVVWVVGDAGKRLASNLLAGTIFIQGEVGADWGSGMRRGTILLHADWLDRCAAQLTSPHWLELSFMPLLWKRIQKVSIELRSEWLSASIPTQKDAHRRVGDRSIQGLAEILCLNG